MNKINLNKTTTYLIASAWLINGLYCKVLNLVPRHEQIVSKITGSDYSHQLTILIGILEIIMAVWILSTLKPKLNAFAQIVIIATMNTLEFIIVPDLLFWGKFNSLFAFALILIVFFNNFKIYPEPKNNQHGIIS